MVTNERSCFLENFTTLPYYLMKRKITQPGNKPFYSSNNTVLKGDPVNGPLAVDAFIKTGNAVVLWW